MTEFEMNRRALIAGATMTAAFAASPALAKKKQRFVINALGGLGDPQGGPLTDEEIANHFLPVRPITDTRMAGIAATNVTLGYVFGEGDPFVSTIEDIAWWDEAIRLRSGDLIKIRSVEDIKAAYKKGRAGVIYGFQSSEMFAGDPERASIFADLGVRVCQMTYNLRGASGDGCLVPENAGLTKFGLDLVAALNAKRLLVDLSHGGEKATMDAIAASKAPIAITHTGCAALASHPRNKTDAELKALADKGGVMGVYFMPYLTPGRQHMAADIVAHIEHALNVCGEDHVGLGLDHSVTAIDNMPAYMEAHRKNTEERRKLGVAAPNESADIILVPPDLMGPAQFDKLAMMLSARGHSEARVQKILGGNFLRLFGEVWGA